MQICKNMSLHGKYFYHIYIYIYSIYCTTSLSGLARGPERRAAASVSGGPPPGPSHVPSSAPRPPTTHRQHVPPPPPTRPPIRHVSPSHPAAPPGRGDRPGKGPGPRPPAGLAVRSPRAHTHSTHAHTQHARAGAHALPTARALSQQTHRHSEACLRVFHSFSGSAPHHAHRQRARGPAPAWGPRT